MTHFSDHDQDDSVTTKKGRSRPKSVRKERPSLKGILATPAVPSGDVQEAIVSSIHAQKIEVLSHGTLHEAKLTLEMLREHLDIAVGDHVMVGAQTNEEPLFIFSRKERKSVVARARGDRTKLSSSSLTQHVLAANVDIGVVTVSLRNPDFHPKFLDRYLVVLQDGNVQPVICLTKCDLSPERPAMLDSYREMGIPVVETSKLSDEGIDRLKSILKGKVAVFVGQSGVGKSSLVNRLIPELNVQTQTISSRTGKGRHTTTRSNVYQWNHDSYIIDTPGIRSLSLEGIDKNQVRFLFPEFSNVSGTCKFANCLHDSEPGCAVKRSMEAGEGIISKYRYESYLRILKE